MTFELRINPFLQLFLHQLVEKLPEVRKQARTLLKTLNLLENSNLFIKNLRIFIENTVKMQGSCLFVN